MGLPNPCEQKVLLPTVKDRVEVQTVPANLLRDIENADIITDCETLRDIIQNTGTTANINGGGVLTNLHIEQIPAYTILSVRQSRKPLLANGEINPLNPLNSTTISGGIQSTQVDAYTDILKINNFNALELQ